MIILIKVIYLKHVYRNRLSFKFECADHCANFGLSYESTDNLVSNLNKNCNHKHNRHCLDCNQIEFLKKEFEFEIKNTNACKTDKIETLERMNQCLIYIFEWKRHIMRSFSQDFIKHKVLNELKSGDALIFRELHMKFNPLLYRETTEQWYGKKGMSWHVTVAIFLDKEGKKNTLTF